MELFTDEVMRGLLAQSLKTASFDGTRWTDPGGGGGSNEAAFVDWLTIREQHPSVRDDVVRIRRHPLVPPDITIHGFVYDVATGRLDEVPEGSAAGRPSQSESPR